MPQDDIRNLDELKAVLSSDARFAAYHVTGTGDGWVEVRVGEGGLTLAAASLIRDRAAIEPHLVRSAAGKTMLLLVGTDDELGGVDILRDRYELALVTLPLARARLYVTMKNYLDLVALRAREQERGRTAEKYRSELGELVSIARAISSERDIDKLLGLILERSRYVTGADAGSVYIVEGQSLNPRERTVRFMVSQNDSIDINFSEHTFPVDDKTIVGKAIISRKLINISDLAREKHDRRFDQSSGYQTRSMLTVPMINQRDEVIGVIQLINRRKEAAPPRLKAPIDFDDWVVPFDERSEELTTTLAAQAGISLENTLLYEDIRRLFEGFVNASVTAIESRDPTTSGHSQRVATLTVGLAEMVDRTGGLYQSVHFTPDRLKEIEYAALLHDFGKVGVREKVLVKAKKLYEDERETLLQRFDYIRKWVESDALKKKLEAALREGAAGVTRMMGELDADEKRRLAEVDDFVAFILKANEPTVLAEGSFERLAEIAQHRFVDPRGESRPFLTPSEMDALKLPRGSLTAQERLEIESHVVHTYNFLENIPWGRKLGAIPTIAGSHHEKLDGTGYPRGLKGDEIRIESRMMTISDIFDALTASDRPYKKAVPVEKALDIIGFEVKDGKCDKELYRIFVESKVWQRVLPG
ncbi:MAG TPA: HD domain-containing phosphohydrolase [Polyangia bacterium]|nr:HD domain-containing phosphohydrolase [Polyangia bacterium]